MKNAIGIVDKATISTPIVIKPNAEATIKPSIQ